MKNVPQNPAHHGEGDVLAHTKMVCEALTGLDGGWCGEPRRQALRETVCALIRYHSLPPHAVYEKDGARRLLKAAASGELLPDFNVELLCLLARARASSLLRRKQPFVWNATSVTADLRRMQVELFTAYHASVRIVYLETAWEEQCRRNAGRAAVVPEDAILRMLAKLAPPERFEAHWVEWHCV